MKYSHEDILKLIEQLSTAFVVHEESVLRTIDQYLFEGDDQFSLDQLFTYLDGLLDVPHMELSENEAEEESSESDDDEVDNIIAKLLKKILSDLYTHLNNGSQSAEQILEICKSEMFGQYVITFLPAAEIKKYLDLLDELHNRGVNAEQIYKNILTLVDALKSTLISDTRTFNGLQIIINYVSVVGAKFSLEQLFTYVTYMGDLSRFVNENVRNELIKKVLNDSHISLDDEQSSAEQILEYMDKMGYYDGNDTPITDGISSADIGSYLDLLGKILKKGGKAERVFEHLHCAKLFRMARTEDVHQSMCLLRELLNKGISVEKALKCIEHVICSMHMTKESVASQILGLLIEIIQKGLLAHDRQQLMNLLNYQNSNGITLGIWLTLNHLPAVVCQYLDLLNELHASGETSEKIYEHLSKPDKGGLTLGVMIARNGNEDEINNYIQLLVILTASRTTCTTQYHDLFASLLDNCVKEEQIEKPLKAIFNSVSEDITTKELIHAVQRKDGHVSLLSAFMPYISQNLEVLAACDRENIFSKIKLFKPDKAVYYLNQCLDKTTPLGKRFNEKEPLLSAWGIQKRIKAAIKEIESGREVRVSDAPASSKFGSPATRLTAQQQEKLDNLNNSMYQL